MVKDMINAQKDAMGYALTACSTVMLCSKFSASMAAVLKPIASDFSACSAMEKPCLLSISMSSIVC